MRTLRQVVSRLVDFDPWEQSRVGSQPATGVSANTVGFVRLTFFVSSFLALSGIFLLLSRQTVGVLLLVVASSLLGFGYFGRTVQLGDVGPAEVPPGCWCPARGGVDDWFVTVAQIRASFFHWQLGSPETWFALSTGAMVRVPVGERITVAIPCDPIRKLRPTQLQNSGEVPIVAADVWQALDEVWFHGTCDGAILSASAETLERAVKLRLLNSEKRGFGSSRKRYYSLTEAGLVSYAAHKREDGVEVLPDAQKPGSNGVSVSNSPAAVVVAGDHNVINAYSSQTGLNQADLAALAELISRVKDGSIGLDGVDEEVAREEAVALESVIENDGVFGEADRSRLRKLVGIVGATAAGVLGNATWELIKGLAA